MKYEDTPLAGRILKHVSRKEYKPVKPKILARQLKLADDQLRELKKTIKRLVKTGQLVWGSNHIVQKGADRPQGNEVIGTFRRASGGYGFVTPRVVEGDSPESRSEFVDVFIPARKTSDAADGDIVKVRVSRQKSERTGKNAELRLSGKILEVLRRRTHRFVGTYRERADQGYVTVDAAVFDADILVGDAGAKNCRHGDKVVIEMVRFPSRQRGNSLGEGVIVEVLGDRGKPGVDTLTVIREFDLPDDFSPDVLDDARKEAEKFDEAIGERTDFTQDTVITIDPKEARDFDDAISLQRQENGHWVLGVHIADVSHFVRPNTHLDNEAYARATSVYLPDRVIPMLPETISNNLASLQPDRLRYTMSVLIEFNPDGIPVNTELHRGVIRSAHRFNYEEIDEYLENDAPWKQKLPADVFRLVRDMHTLAMMLRQRRLDGGSIELSLPATKIDLDKDGKVVGAHEEINTESHQVIEEFMLAANQAVAVHLSDQGLFLIRRIHEPPSPAKLKQLTEFVRGLGIQADSLESRFEIKRVIAEANDRPERAAIHYAVLRSMQKAVYGPDEVGHYALNSENYCHFTSPIRRYPDLIVHRMVGSLIDGKKPSTDFGRLAKLGEHCSEREQRAEKAERELVKLKLLNFLADKLGTEMKATITGVESYGIFARCEELPVEGMVPIENLPQDHYFFDRPLRLLLGRKDNNSFRLGDPIRVRVSLVDLDRRELELELIGRLKSPERPRSKSGKRSASKRTSRSPGSQTTSSRRKSSSPSGSRNSRKRKSTASDKSNRARKSSKKKSKAASAKRKSSPSAKKKGTATKKKKTRANAKNARASKKKSTGKRPKRSR